MMKFSSLTSFFVILFLFPLTVRGQEKRFEYQILGVFTHQIDQEYPNPNQIGGGIGFGIYTENKVGKLGFEASILALNRRTLKYSKSHTYEGISLTGKLNFLFKTISLGEKYVYIGPGIGIYQPLNWDEKFSGYNGYGPSFGLNAKILVPVRISDFSFYLTYDFDFITAQGYIRNSVGVSFWP